jgi:hypothetical protein
MDGRRGRLGWRLAVVASAKDARSSFEQQYIDRYWVIEDDRLTGPVGADITAERYARFAKTSSSSCVSGGSCGRDGRSGTVRSHQACRGFNPTSISEESLLAGFTWLDLCARHPSHSGTRCPAVHAKDTNDPPAARRTKLAPGVLIVTLMGRIRFFRLLPGVRDTEPCAPGSREGATLVTLCHRLSPIR